MILRTTQPQHAADEKELRDWLQANLGVEDAELLAAWIWENEHRTGPVAYLSGLAQVVQGAATMGRSFVGNLLDMAKKPKEVRDAELELTRFAGALLRKLTDRVRAHGGDPAAAHEAELELRARVREKVEAMWPGTPDYIINGAMAVGVTHKNGAFGVEVAHLVKGMLQEDVLKRARGST